MLEYIGGIFRQATRFSPVLTLSEAKDKIRQHLGREDPSLGFPGSEGIDIYHLCKKVLTSDTNIVDKQYICRSCRYEGEVSSLNVLIWILDKFIWQNQVNRMGSYKDRPISSWIKANCT